MGKKKVRYARDRTGNPTLNVPLQELSSLSSIEKLDGTVASGSGRLFSGTHAVHDETIRRNGMDAEATVMGTSGAHASGLDAASSASGFETLKHHSSKQFTSTMCSSAVSAGDVEHCIQTLYDYVHNAMVTKDDKKKMKLEVNNLFGEGASQTLIHLLETQRKDMSHRVKDFQTENEADGDEMYAWTQSMQRYLESVQGWWDCSVKPFLHSTHTASTSQQIPDPLHTNPLPLHRDEMYRVAPELLPEDSDALLLCGPFPEPAVWFPWAEGLPRNPVFEFYLKLAHISSESLMKVLESMRLKTISSSRREMQEILMDKILRSGAERFAQLMEKHGILWEVFGVTRPSILADRLCNHLFHTINSIPAPSFPKVAKALGLTLQHATKEIVSRTLIYGLKDVLKNVKTRLLKRVIHEVSSILQPNAPGEVATTGPPPSRDLIDIICHVFPNDARRPDPMLSSDRANAKLFLDEDNTFRRGLQFISATRKGNFGLTTWQINNVNAYLRFTGKLLSPIFEYGGLYWNMIVHQHNENLTVSLYQAAEVHCAFAVTFHAKESCSSMHREAYHHFTGKIGEIEWNYPLVVPIAKVAQVQLCPPSGSHAIIPDDEMMVILEVRIGILANESEVHHLTKAGWEGQYNFCRTPAEPSVMIRPPPAVVSREEMDHAKSFHDAAEMARRELERELEDEQRKRSKREQIKMSKAATSQIKTQEAKVRRDIESEAANKLASIKEDSAKEITRLHKIRKQREKIPKMMYSLQQQHDTLQRKIDDVHIAIADESEVIAHITEELEKIEMEQVRCKEETTKLSAELETVTAELTETLELMEALKNAPRPSSKRYSGLDLALHSPFSQNLTSSNATAIGFDVPTTLSSSSTARSSAMSGLHGHNPLQTMSSIIPATHPAMDFMGISRQRPTADSSLFDSVIGGTAFGTPHSSSSGGWKSWSPI